MAKSSDKAKPTSDKQVTPRRVLKKPQSLRERAEKSVINNKPRRIKRVSLSALRPIKSVARTGRKEYYLPLPDNKIGRFLNKRRKFIPSYFRNSYKELRQVKWPTHKETLKLTFAVFVFAIFFTTIITLADFGLDKVFKNFILK